VNLSSVTVVIPTFNSATTIKRALNSVLAQTVLPRRLVVVDNASTDSTAQIVEKMAADSLCDVELVRQPRNTGPGAARNAGWDLVRTQFVAFLDSDDSWHPTKLERQLDIAMQHPDEFFFGHTTTSSKTSDTTETFGTTPLIGSGRINYFSLRHFLVRNRVSTPTVMLRSDLPFRFPIEHWFAEDYALWTAILAAGYRAVVHDLTLTTLHKAAWGEAGLSAKLDDMHAGELLVLDGLRRDRAIGEVEHAVFRTWMTLKYRRRLRTGRARV
jgi:glycosyltransferase involved in cell wall biosynthesis